MKKNKGFTLIELVAVLVIMAIIALIVTPLVMSIIRKAKIAADKRSVDAYGRSIELAIAGYLMDTGTFPTSISQLTIEYSGDEVVCTTTQLKSDSSIYLAGCTVGGRSVEGYTYGKEEAALTYTAYNVGDIVRYNGIDYYVIKDSSASEENVTMLKAEPLSVAEANQYGGVGTVNNHVNMYSARDTSEPYYQQAADINGYGGVGFYSSETCGYVNGEYVGTSCKNTYADSEIKYVVDAWKNAQAPAANEARLITIDELSDLGYGYEYLDGFSNGIFIELNENVPSWLYNSNYGYWTMSAYDVSPDNWPMVWFVYDDGDVIFCDHGVQDYDYAVRPVITLSKTNISS